MCFCCHFIMQPEPICSDNVCLRFSLRPLDGISAPVRVTLHRLMNIFHVEIPVPTSNLQFGPYLLLYEGPCCKTCLDPCCCLDFHAVLGTAWWRALIVLSWFYTFFVKTHCSFSPLIYYVLSKLFSVSVFWSVSTFKTWVWKFYFFKCCS